MQKTIDKDDQLMIWFVVMALFGLVVGLCVSFSRDLEELRDRDACLFRLVSEAHGRRLDKVSKDLTSAVNAGRKKELGEIPTLRYLKAVPCDTGSTVENCVGLQ